MLQRDVGRSSRSMLQKAKCESSKSIFQRVRSRRARARRALKGEKHGKKDIRKEARKGMGKGYSGGKGSICSPKNNTLRKRKRVCKIREGVWERYGKPSMPAHGKGYGKGKRNPTCLTQRMRILIVPPLCCIAVNRTCFDL